MGGTIAIVGGIRPGLKGMEGQPACQKCAGWKSTGVGEKDVKLPCYTRSKVHVSRTTGEGGDLQSEGMKEFEIFGVIGQGGAGWNNNAFPD